MSLNLGVTVSGRIFEGGIAPAIEQQIKRNVLDKVEERWNRTPKRKKNTLGRRNNTLSSNFKETSSESTLETTTTTNWPRTKGVAWEKHNIAAARKLAPNVVRKTTQAIAEEMNR